MNVRRILEILQERGPSSRAELTRFSGISAPTVSKAVATLLESGLLEEAAPAETTSVGRPGKVLRLATERSRVIGVVFDAGRTGVMAAGLDGQPVKSTVRSFPTPGTYRQLIDRTVQSVKDLSDDEAVATLGVGISIPGLVNSRTNQAVFSPNLHITDGRYPARDLSERLGVDCVLFHELHALCLAERMCGGARGMNDFAMMDVTTGLGLGVLSGGQLLEGRSGLAGELGHVTVEPAGRLCGCGNRGCLETVATDTALAKRISERLGRSMGIDEVIALIRDGELRAEQELLETCEYLAIAFAAAINLFNPATLFVYGRLFEAQDGLFEQLVDLTRRRALKPSMDDCTIVQARGNKPQGAVAGVIHHLTDSIGPPLG